MTSADALRARSEQDLVLLLLGRPDLAVPPPTDTDVLAHRAAGRLSVVRALERLDTFTLEVLQDLVDPDDPDDPVDPVDPVNPVDPVDGSPGDHDGVDLTPALEKLRELGLIWSDSDSDTGRDTDRGALDPDTVAVHETVLEVLGRPIDALGRSFTELGLDNPGDLAAALADCDPAENAVLERLVAGFSRGTFHSSTGEHPVRRLLDRGLLADIGADQVELPGELGAAVRARPRMLHPQPPAIEPRVHDGGTVQGTAAGQVLEALRTVDAMLDCIAGDPPAQLRSGGLGSRELRRISRAVDRDEQTVALLLEVTHAAGLLAATRDANPVWLPTTDFDDWRERSAEHRWPTLATAWLAMRRLPMLVGRRDDNDRLLVPLSPPLDRAGTPEIRRQVLGFLDELPVGSAPDAAQVDAVLTWRAPRRGGRIRTETIAATLREAETLGVTGRGALGAAGAAALQGTDVTAALADTLPEPIDDILLQADLTAIAPGPLVSELASELMLVADVESAGGATVYRITADSVRRALDSGRTAADLHRLFGTHSRTPVPQSLTYLIDDTARRHGGLRVGAVRSYLRCEDDATLSVVLAERRLEPLGLRRLAPSIAVSSLPPTELLELLRDVGHAPMLEAADGSVLIEPPIRRRSTPDRPTRSPLPVPPDKDRLRAIIDDMRTGDIRSRARARVSRAVGEVPGVTTAGVLGTLQQALESGQVVDLSYVDNSGLPVTRTVKPRGISAGFLRAEDERAESTMSVALHRVTSVTAAEGKDADT